jgi:cysteine-rich repeat protein
MRTTLLAPFFALSLIACVGTIDSGQGDDDVPANCGNGNLDEGETCDEGDTIDGDGCSSSCQTEATPRLDVTVDKPTIATELMTTHMITVTLTGSDGFAGPVNLTPSVVDANNMPITTWTVALDQISVDVPANGVATAVATVTIPSINNGLEGRVKFAAASSAGVGTFEAISAVTAMNQVSFSITTTGGNCQYPTGTTQVKAGTSVRLVNGGDVNVIFHSDGGAYNLPHQDVGGGGSNPTQAYTNTVANADGSAFRWYCHAPGPDLGPNNPQILVVP